MANIRWLHWHTFKWFRNRNVLKFVNSFTVKFSVHSSLSISFPGIEAAFSLFAVSVPSSYLVHSIAVVIKIKAIMNCALFVLALYAGNLKQIRFQIQLWTKAISKYITNPSLLDLWFLIISFHSRNPAQFSISNYFHSQWSEFNFWSRSIRFRPSIN